ncbi:MAG: type II toxin-antitoxin system VapC family toxin [Thermoanaerobaculia bacterium]
MNAGWVVDASVAVKPYLREDLAETAKRLLRTAYSRATPLFVPDLFYSECANIFLKHVRRSALSSDHARRSLDNLKSLPLRPFSGARFLALALDRSFELALRYELSAYDAAYVTTAQVLEVPLVTADEKLIRKLAGSSVEICFLGDLPL